MAVQPAGYDVIVDDASHRAADVIASFELLFPRALRSKGIYIMEDIHWPGTGTGTGSVLDYVQRLRPYLWLCETPSRCPVRYGASSMAAVEHQDWRYEIESITLHRDVIVFVKK